MIENLENILSLNIGISRGLSLKSFLVLLFLNLLEGGRGVQLCGFQLVFFYDFILFPLFIIFRANFDFQIPRPTQQKRKKGTLT